MHAITTIMTELAGCLCREIHDSGMAEPCFCGVMPGDRVALDYVGNCEDRDGMAWVRLVASYPSTGIGTLSITPNNCGSSMSVDLEVGIIRTAPMMAEDGEPPDEAAQLAAVDQQMTDMMTMFKAISCCPALDSYAYIAGIYKPMGPQGYALGGTVPVTVGL